MSEKKPRPFDARAHLTKLLNSRNLMKALAAQGVDADFAAYLFGILKEDIADKQQTGQVGAAANQAKATIRLLTDLLKHIEGHSININEEKEIEKLSPQEVLKRLNSLGEQ